MGRRRAPGGGRKRKPTHLKILEGTFRKDRANPNEPEPEAAILEPPAILDAVAKREWRRACKVLFDHGVITRLDRAVLTAYCQAWSQFTEAEHDIQERGTFLPITTKRVTEKGEEVEVVIGHQKNPYCALRKEAREILVRTAGELGLTPASRPKVQGTAKPPKKGPAAAPAAPAPPGGAGAATGRFWKTG